jgi:hypothetical protein
MCASKPTAFAKTGDTRRGKPLFRFATKFRSDVLFKKGTIEE